MFDFSMWFDKSGEFCGETFDLCPLDVEFFWHRRKDGCKLCVVELMHQS